MCERRHRRRGESRGEGRGGEEECVSGIEGEGCGEGVDGLVLVGGKERGVENWGVRGREGMGSDGEMGRDSDVSMGRGME